MKEQNERCSTHNRLKGTECPVYGLPHAIGDVPLEIVAAFRLESASILIPVKRDVECKHSRPCRLCLSLLFGLSHHCSRHLHGDVPDMLEVR